MTAYWEKNFETSSRHILRPEYASNDAVRRPYKWAHLSPAAIDNAIRTIHGAAQPGSWPRHFYDMGRSTDPKVGNWVLKWLLWHVCRYRDWRNRKNRSSASAAATNAALVSGAGSSATHTGSSATGGTQNLNPASRRSCCLLGLEVARAETLTQ